MRAVILLLSLMAMVSPKLFSQVADKIEFSTVTHDFGTIDEEGGPVTYEFTFINNTDGPIKILNVHASCGCTTPGWSKEEVAPGESGYVQAQYNPHNRPGQFTKSLTVTTSLGQEVRLIIKGDVTPKSRLAEEDLPNDMDGLRMKYRSFNMGKVLTSEEPTIKTFDLFNATDSVMLFSDRTEAPAYIQVTFRPHELAPHSRGEIEISYDGKMKNDVGFGNENLTFYTNQKGSDSVKSVSVFATVLEYFPPMSDEELDAAPRLVLNEATHDFDKVSGDDQVSTKVKLTNLGNKPLLIRKVEPNCSCVVVNVPKDRLDAGEFVEVEVIFHASGRKGNQQKSVTFYSNDPRHPVQRFTFKAYVTE